MTANYVECFGVLYIAPTNLNDEPELDAEPIASDDWQPSCTEF